MAKKKKPTPVKRPAAKKAARPQARAKPAARPKAAAKAKAPAKPRDGRPAQWWPALSPYLTVRNGQASIEFYARAFGFEAYGEVMRNDDGEVQHAGMRLGEAAVMFGPAEGSMGLRVPDPASPDSLTLYVYVADVDALFGRAQRGGAKVVQAPADQFWGDRTAVLKDPDGYHWTFATHFGARVPQ